jgi:hypothetical protein
MNLTFVDDYSSAVVLDTELTGTPASGMYFNRGVHPLITLDNIINHLSHNTITFSAYSALSTYGNYMSTRLKSDIVSSGGKIYQSIVAGNLNNTPSSSPTKWVETTLEAIKIKTEIFKSEDAMIADLNLSRKLVENQFIYNIGTNTVALQGDFSGWAFKVDSDYTKIRINKIALQANTTSQVDIFIINQGTLIHTISVTPQNGILSFTDSGYVLSGKGIFYVVFASQSVKASTESIDPLKYRNFTCYPVQGVGATAAGSEYKQSSCNGLNFNVTVYLDSTEYIKDNLIDFSSALQARFELDMLDVFYCNPNIMINSNTRNVAKTPEFLGNLYNEIKGIEGETVRKKYKARIKEALEAMNLTFDKMTKLNTEFKIKLSTL